jgi:ribulose-phosphate 3-epimerase
VFIPRSLHKVRQVAQMRRDLGLSFRIEIDGGIDRENLPEVARAGCDWVVTGTSVFHTPDPAQAVAELRRIAAGATMVSC